MEINVGEFVRTKDGIIKRVISYNPQENNPLWETLNGNVQMKGTITKHSKDIIDIIEVGDYVNGYLIDYINLECETPFLRSNRPYRTDNSLYSTLIKEGKDYNQPLHFYNEDIKSIVTKEQFKANAYTIEKER